MTLIVVIVMLAVTLALTLAGGEPKVKVTPRQTDELLANPHMGWQTFHRFAGEDENLAGLPSTSAYFRLYWREIEPVAGEIDFARFDDLLARAKRAGQRLAFRIMCAGTTRDYMYVPQWLKDKGCPGFEYERRGEGPKHWVPDMRCSRRRTSGSFGSSASATTGIRSWTWWTSARWGSGASGT
jgi:hypothetical protein